MNSLVIITGGTKGIGKSLVSRFMDGGYDIITCSRSEKELSLLKEKMEALYPSQKLYFCKVDVSFESEILQFVNYIHTFLPQRSIEVIINNAGFFSGADITNSEDGELKKLIDTNLYSAYYLTKKLAYILKQKKRGHIFNICSIASLKAYPNGGLYTISKFALYGFSKALREELIPYNIKVTSVLPGATFTDSWKDTHLPKERFIAADDIANIIFQSYLTSHSTLVEDIIIRPLLGDL
ncbi:MAG: SDR family oxidoreductase [Chitinophagaceae bacterium]|nr:SDR family oxidoreductase [Chitinophagaceae bacterium]